MRLPVFVGLVPLIIAGCAHYSTSSGLIGGIRSIAIPQAENATAEELVSESLTERATDAFTTDGRLKVVDEESADGLLLLRLSNLEDRPFTFTAQEETNQYRVRLWVDVILLKTEEDSELLELEALEGWGTYDADADDEAGRDIDVSDGGADVSGGNVQSEGIGRNVAIESALDMVIEEVVDRTTATW